MSGFSSLVSAVTTALGVIKTAGNLPGVNLIPYVSTVANVASVLQFAIEKGQNVTKDIADFKATFSDGLPPQDKLDELDARIERLRAKLHMPLPDAEEGEED